MKRSASLAIATLVAVLLQDASQAQAVPTPRHAASSATRMASQANIGCGLNCTVHPADTRNNDPSIVDGRAKVGGTPAGEHHAIEGSEIQKQAARKSAVKRAGARAHQVAPPTPAAPAAPAQQETH